ncbi:MFS transporter [Streptomyces sp. NPDC047108]|uniref:MFS transporter n=1 Tax=Streptomyces sp. NPDC047108 TaxID=3155025 RepID=UPI0033D53556
MARLVDLPGYVRLWTAATVSSFGTHVTTLALQILAAVTLHATAFELGLLNAARWLPYLLFGLVAGVVVDRCRRKPVLVATDLGRAVLLAVIPLLDFVDLLGIAALALFVFAFGVLSLLFEAAHQSYLPRLVPRELLTPANARLEQAGSVAQTTGPLIGGALIKAVGAPVAMVADAVSYLVSGLLLASVTAPEPERHAVRRNLRAELREGLAWVYRHRTLAPMALTSHARFLFAHMLTTVYVLYALRELRIGAFGLGVSYACAGVGAVLGGALSGWAGRRFDVGPTMIATRAVVPFAWLLVPLASPGSGAVWAVSATQFAMWLALGAESPTELGYRQSVTPDRLLGRMNATIRSLNWGMIAVGAPLGGLLADIAGYRPALWTGIAGLAVAAVVLGLSRFREARLADGADAVSAS